MFFIIKEFNDREEFDMKIKFLFQTFHINHTTFTEHCFDVQNVQKRLLVPYPCLYA